VFGKGCCGRAGSGSPAYLSRARRSLAGLVALQPQHPSPSPRVLKTPVLLIRFLRPLAYAASSASGVGEWSEK